MKMKSLSLLILLILIAFVACRSTTTDMDLKQHDQQQTNARAVVHDRRGAYGSSDLNRKPSQTKNGVNDLPLKTLGGISFWVSMVVSCFFLLV